MYSKVINCNIPSNSTNNTFVPFASSDRSGVSDYTNIEKGCLQYSSAFQANANPHIDIKGPSNEDMCMKRFGSSEMLSWCKFSRNKSTIYEESSSFTAYPTLITRTSHIELSRCWIYNVTIRARYKYGSGEWNNIHLRLVDGVILSVKDQNQLPDNQIFSLYPFVILRRFETIRYEVCNTCEELECKNASVIIPTLNDQAKQVSYIKIYEY